MVLKREGSFELVGGDCQCTYFLLVMMFLKRIAENLFVIMKPLPNLLVKYPGIFGVS